MSEVEVAVLVRLGPAGARRLAGEAKAAAAAAAAVARRRLPKLSIAVVGDRRMRRLNRDHHAVDATTDVLAFPLDPGEGEVVVCAPVASREAARRGLPARTELLLYVVHGVLHLLGEDDDVPPRARRMRRLERAALARLGKRLPASHLRESKDDAVPARRRRV